MADQGREADAAPEAAQAFMRDWITLWRSELAALASDRELAESWARIGRFWAAAARTAPDAPDRDGTGAGTPAGSPAADAAPDAAGFARLAARVAELERRLDRFERG